MDDTLPELAHSSYYTLNDATSGFWQTMEQGQMVHTTIWPQDIQQCVSKEAERGVRLLPGVTGIADGSFTYGRLGLCDNGGQVKCLL